MIATLGSSAMVTYAVLPSRAIVTPRGEPPVSSFHVTFRRATSMTWIAFPCGSQTIAILKVDQRRVLRPLIRDEHVSGARGLCNDGSCTDGERGEEGAGRDDLRVRHGRTSPLRSTLVLHDIVVVAGLARVPSHDHAMDVPRIVDSLPADA